MEWTDGVLSVDPFRAVTWGIVVLFVGRWLIARSRWLRDYNIPEPVAGGLIFALLSAFMHFVLDVTVQFDKEGIKDERETVATRSSGSEKPDSAMATLDISSVPDGAEIEIDGSFVGTTPRTKILEPGKYAIKLTKAGFKSWQRKIEVAAGEQVPVKVELEKK